VRLKILDYSWHQVHLYRMAQALPATFTVVGVKVPHWNTAQRPIPDNVRLVGIHEFDEDVTGYDVAILHLDQWVDRLNLRASPFRWMRETTREIPQVVIMHGTPDNPQNRKGVLRLIGDLPVVCNSRQAAREWDGGEGRLDRYGLPQFRAIIHGYTDEFFYYPLSYRSLGAITICSGGDMSRWYHGLSLVERLKREVPLTWYGPRGDQPWRPNYTSYRGLLASALIYFSPTRRGPMPGSRTEAMLSGCCVVSVSGQDAEDYIETGVNGFIVRTYSEAVECLRWLLENPEAAYRVGLQGRKDALKFFDHRRYAANWVMHLMRMGIGGNDGAVDERA